MKVNVVDSIMGSGKTSAMINMINDEIKECLCFIVNPNPNLGA